MLGFGVNKGIVPLACEEIFNRINRNTQKNKLYEVTVSMIEIYNEKVQDLLLHDSRQRPPGGLEIRESKKLGVYVEGVTKHTVRSFREIEKWM
jgi:kinesin family protein 13